MSKLIAAYTPSQSQHIGLVPFINAYEQPDGQVTVTVRSGGNDTKLAAITLQPHEWAEFKRQLLAG